MKKHEKFSRSSFIAKYKELFMPAGIIDEKRWWFYEAMQWLSLILGIAAIVISSIALLQ